MNGAYYNEHDRFAAAWLRELINEGLIADGEVDERNIQDVTADDLRGFTQCHFFAGIGGWSYALRLAGWADDRAVWTGSCPCQPFSIAGKRRGDADVRDLWPVWFRIIRECAPSVVFGEQVAGPDGYRWLARVHADLEAASFAFGAADLCAASAGAPHLRQRLFFVADAISERLRGEGRHTTRAAARTVPNQNREREWFRSDVGSTGLPALAVDDADRRHGFWWSGPLQVGRNAIEGEVTRGGRKYRAQWRVGPGVRIVAPGIPNRVGTLCGAGNAIVPQVAAEVISAYMQIEADRVA